MEINIEFIIFCEKAIQSENNLVSFINVFDNLNIEKVPAISNSFCIAIRISAENIKNSEEAEIEFKLISPSKTEIISGNLDRKLTKKQDKISTIAELNKIPLAETGDYKFQVLSDNNVLKQKILSVVKKP